MGIMASLDFVPHDYKIKYVDSLASSEAPSIARQYRSIKGRIYRVKISKDIIEEIE